MNWDWDKLTERKQRRPSGPVRQDPDPIDDDDEDRGGGFGGGGHGGGGNKGNSGGGNWNPFSFLDRFKGFKIPSGKMVILGLGLLWLGSGIYIVEPDEMGVVRRLGAFDRTAGPGPHYHIPFPIESVTIPKVTQIRRVEIGFRTVEQNNPQGKYRLVPEESLMLTGDENIVDVQFIVQYQIKDAVAYLFTISDPDGAVKDAAEAAMREIIGRDKIDSALTTGKLLIQNDTRKLMQNILDSYGSGIQIAAVQLQDVHPPKEVVDAFKDVASAREDKSRLINEAEGYRNDIIPKARGLAATMINEAMAYKESVTRRAKGESSRFASVLKEYDRARDVTRERLFLDTMQQIMSNPEMEKVVLPDQVSDKTVPYLPLDRVQRPGMPQSKPQPQSEPLVKGGGQ